MRLTDTDCAFRCRVSGCGYVGASNELLSSHIDRMHHRGAVIKCPQAFCQFETRVRKYLCRHIRNVHRKQRSLPCNICGKLFKRPHEVRQHAFRIHSSEKPLKCDQCEFRCKTNWELKFHHRQRHIQTLSFFCCLCSVGTKTKSDLVKHIRRHVGIKKHHCQLCSKRYYSHHELRTHMVCHRSDRPFTCYLCKASFKSKEYLSTHMISHIQPFFYTCNICLKGFSYKYSLKMHIVTHCPDRPHACPCCPFRSHDPLQVKAHFGAAHSDIYPYCCRLCFRRYRNAHTFQSHLTNIHFKGKEAYKLYSSIKKEYDPGLLATPFCEFDYVEDSILNGRSGSRVCKVKSEFKPKNRKPKIKTEQMECVTYDLGVPKSEPDVEGRGSSWQPSAIPTQESPACQPFTVKKESKAHLTTSRDEIDRRAVMLRNLSLSQNRACVSDVLSFGSRSKSSFGKVENSVASGAPLATGNRVSDVTKLRKNGMFGKHLFPRSITGEPASSEHNWTKILAKSEPPSNIKFGQDRNKPASYNARPSRFKTKLPLSLGAKPVAKLSASTASNRDTSLPAAAIQNDRGDLILPSCYVYLENAAQGMVMKAEPFHLEEVKVEPVDMHAEPRPTQPPVRRRSSVLFDCSHCPKRFRYPRALQKHVALVHSAERQETYPSSSLSSSKLRFDGSPRKKIIHTHHSSSHSMNIPFHEHKDKVLHSCPLDGKVFNKPELLEEHRRQCHAQDMSLFSDELFFELPSQLSNDVYSLDSNLNYSFDRHQKLQVNGTADILSEKVNHLVEILEPMEVNISQICL